MHRKIGNKTVLHPIIKHHQSKTKEMTKTNCFKDDYLPSSGNNRLLGFGFLIALILFVCMSN